MVNGRMAYKLTTIRAHLLLVLVSLLAGAVTCLCHPCLAVALPMDITDQTNEGEYAFHPRTGTFLYSVKWEKTPAADIIMTVSKQRDHYRIVADSMVTKAVDFIYRLRYRGEGTVTEDDFSSVQTVLTEHKGSESKTTKIDYHEDGDIETKITSQNKEETPETSIKKFRPEREVLDIFSAVFLSRSVDWRVGLSEQFEVFTGRKTYIVTLNCLEKSLFKKDDFEIDAWVIGPTAVDSNKPSQKPRLTTTRIYLSADSSKDILRIKTKTGFGTIEVLLTDFVPF